MARARESVTKNARPPVQPTPVEPAGAADWLSLALLHHKQIRSAFVRALEAPAGGSRLTAFKGLAVLLNGHSVAEEIVLYPVLAMEKARNADQLYTEQSHAKVEMAALETLDPASEDWAEKLSEIRTAVEEHMQEEEARWFVAIKTSGANQAKLTARYKEEFERYTRAGSLSTNAAWDGPPLTRV